MDACLYTSATTRSWPAIRWTTDGSISQLVQFKAILALRKMAQECTVDAAKYVHSEAGQHLTRQQSRYPLTLSDEERTNAVLALLSKAGIDLRST